MIGIRHRRRAGVLSAVMLALGASGACGLAEPSVGLVTSAAAGCYVKQIDGVPAYLAVWFRSDFNGVEGVVDSPSSEFGLEVTASHDGGAWC